jgi:hypothetical protein
MTLRSSIVVLLIWAATASWGQNSAGPMASRRPTVMASPNSDAQIAVARAKAQGEAKKHVEEMGATLAKMHALLKQMQVKTSAAATKDSVAKANLEMWSMMLDQLDKQYQELAAAQKSREDMEARRLAMYKQADERATAAAAAAKAAQQANAAEEAKAANATSTPAQPAATPAPTEGPSATSSPN